MTKIWAILSDVHGRGDRLKRVLADAGAHGASHVLALGDIGGTSALDVLEAAGATCVFGNWEASGLRGLPSFHRGWVGRWPANFRADGFWAAHASPVWPEALGIAGVVDYLRERQWHWTALFPSFQRSEQARSDALAELEAADVWVFFHGHTHVQEAWRWMLGGTPQRVAGDGLTTSLTIDDGARWLVGVGSVGTPHDGDGACYALYDEDRAPGDVAPGVIHRKVRVFKIGFAQFAPTRCDVAANVATVERLLRGVEADLLVLPELANSGYLHASPDALVPFSEPGDGSGPFLSALQRLAGQTGGVIVAGFAERAPEGLYNSAAAVDASGVIQVYRKTHLFADEKLLFLPGDTGFRVFQNAGVRNAGVRVGMMVCFDWFFPESARTLALRGAQIIAHPSNLVLPYCQTAMFARCLENRVFAVTTNRYGAEELTGTAPGFHRRLADHDAAGRTVEPGAH